MARETGVCVCQLEAYNIHCQSCMTKDYGFSKRPTLLSDRHKNGCIDLQHYNDYIAETVLT